MGSERPYRSVDPEAAVNVVEEGSRDQGLAGLGVQGAPAASRAARRRNAERRRRREDTLAARRRGVLDADRGHRPVMVVVQQAVGHPAARAAVVVLSVDDVDVYRPARAALSDHDLASHRGVEREHVASAVAAAKRERVVNVRLGPRSAIPRRFTRFCFRH